MPYEQTQTPQRSTISVFIVEDHTIIREGLRALLSVDSNIEIVGEADNGYDAIRQIGKYKPQLVLMDLSMPDMNGIEATREIKKRHSDIKIIILTAHKTEEYIRAALETGANGYVLKDATYVELRIAVKSVMEGKVYLSPSVAGNVVVGFLGSSRTSAKSSWDTLTHRERIVLKLIAEGNQNKKIADHLSISVKTVEKHRSNLMKKLDLHNTAAITAFAIERGVVTK